MTKADYQAALVSGGYCARWRYVRPYVTSTDSLRPTHRLCWPIGQSAYGCVGAMPQYALRPNYACPYLAQES